MDNFVVMIFQGSRFQNVYRDDPSLEHKLTEKEYQKGLL